MTFICTRLLNNSFTVLLLFTLLACGGGGESGPTTFTVGGIVTGLPASTSLVLRNNGSDNLTVSADGSFTFLTQVASSATYNVTIAIQPQGRTCVVSNGSGTISGGSVTNVSVNCTPAWTWISGSNVGYFQGSYGTQGVSASTNAPGARSGAVGWLDSFGNRWLFGGQGHAPNSDVGYLNDLWKFDGTNWTWMSGSTRNDAYAVMGNYGMLGVAAATNVPGGRDKSMTWRDSSGSLWLFGGYGYDSTANLGLLNDLWKFDGTNWIWVGGSSTGGAKGVYGTKGAPASTSVPGSRDGAVSWMDGSGNLWLFGGGGWDAAGTLGYLNDLWRFDGTNWTWVGGGDIANATGVYGAKGVAASTNAPGARWGASGWIDGSGKLWLFGGQGYASTATWGSLNDLWKFDGANWIWVSGNNTVNVAGIYGTKGVAASTNAPGSRRAAVFWVDSFGNGWLFGGDGLNSNGLQEFLNDLWKFDGTNWIWMSGDKTGEAAAISGTKGTPAWANVPGARNKPVGWIDSTNNLWLFGGRGKDSNGTRGELNDLWRYQP